MILHVGAAEKAEINHENRGLLKEICAYRAYYCLDEKASAHDGVSGVSMPGESHQ
jgi:hypothetical protein